MKPVYQAIDRPGFHATGNGDCLRACVASLLELPLEDVPHFMETPESAREWPQALTAWLHGRGRVLETLALPGDLEAALAYMAAHHPREHYILAGRAGPDFGHVIIGLGGRIVHDPSPRVSDRGVSQLGPLPCGLYAAMMIRNGRVSFARAANQRERLLLALGAPASS